MHRAAEYLPADMKEEDLKPPAVPFYSPVEEGDERNLQPERKRSKLSNPFLLS